MENRSSALLAIDRKTCTMDLTDPLRDSESQTGPFDLTARSVGAIETVKDMRQVGRRDSNAVILNRDCNFLGGDRQPSLLSKLAPSASKGS